MAMNMDEHDLFIYVLPVKTSIERPLDCKIGPDLKLPTVDGCEILHHLVWLKPYE